MVEISLHITSVCHDYITLIYSSTYSVDWLFLTTIANIFITMQVTIQVLLHCQRQEDGKRQSNFFKSSVSFAWNIIEGWSNCVKTNLASFCILCLAMSGYIQLMDLTIKVLMTFRFLLLTFWLKPRLWWKVKLKRRLALNLKKVEWLQRKLLP